MTQSPLLRHLVPLVLAALAPLTASADVVSSINKVRAQGCPGHRGGLLALRRNSRLDAVARQLSRGTDLRRAEKIAGYHAVASASVQISGVPNSGDVERIVARQFCSASTEPQFREIGTYWRGSEVWIALAEPFAPPAIHDAAAISRRVLALTNEARAHARRCGGTRFEAAPPLALNLELERAALLHSQDMAVHNYMDHTGRDGSSPADRITRTGYKWRMVGENLASGTLTPEETVSGWLGSPHHCANLMTARFTEMGIAFAVNAATDAGVYWTQTFGTRY
ncbi:MAG TPA: CAP domain-containing protein [Steroidobacteraceae bacterium]|nr:CAP domain-containing protein [Steroidobacteraceae bacterium]